AAYHRNPESRQWQVLHAPCLLGRGDVGTWVAAVRRNAPQFSVRLLGDGSAAFPELAALPGIDCVGDERIPQANAVAQLAYASWQRGDVLDPSLAAPLYVRDKVAYTTLEREQGLGGNPKAVVSMAATGFSAAEPFSIVRMSQAHVPAVARIERSVQQHAWTEKNFQDALAAGYDAWVGMQGDTITGFCLLMLAPDVAHLLLIAVD